MELLHKAKLHFGIGSDHRSVSGVHGRIERVKLLTICSLALTVASLASFRWVWAVIRGAGDGSGGHDVSEWHGLGLQWYQHMQVQPNYYTGGNQVQYSYVAVDSKLATLNDVNKMSNLPTADPAVTHTSTGLLAAAVAMHVLALMALMVLQRGVNVFRLRRVVFLAVPLLSGVGGILCVGAAAHWGNSNVKEVACVFFAGPGALEPNQTSSCGYGASLYCCIAAVPLALLQALAFAVWLQGDTAALLCGVQQAAAGAASAGRGAASMHTPPPHEASGLLRQPGGR